MAGRQIKNLLFSQVVLVYCARQAHSIKADQPPKPLEKSAGFLFLK
jgi:hypothetical protein